MLKLNNLNLLDSQTLQNRLSSGLSELIILKPSYVRLFQNHMIWFISLRDNMDYLYVTYNAWNWYLFQLWDLDLDSSLVLSIIIIENKMIVYENFKSFWNVQEKYFFV